MASFFLPRCIARFHDISYSFRNSYYIFIDYFDPGQNLHKVLLAIQSLPAYHFWIDVCMLFDFLSVGMHTRENIFQDYKISLLDNDTRLEEAIVHRISTAFNAFQCIQYTCIHHDV